MFEYECNPSGKGHVCWSFGATDQIHKLIEEELGVVGAFVVDDGVEYFQLKRVELVQTTGFVP